MKRLIVGMGVSAAVFALGVGTASAAKPAVHACVGSSLSSLARTAAAPGDFGHGVEEFARNSETPGLGRDIQALQAGAVTNDVVPNSCNGS